MRRTVNIVARAIQRVPILGLRTGAGMNGCMTVRFPPTGNLEQRIICSVSHSVVCDWFMCYVLGVFPVPRIIDRTDNKLGRKSANPLTTHVDRLLQVRIDPQRLSAALHPFM